MLMAFAVLALLTLFLSLAAWGLALLPRRGWRMALGGLLALESLLAATVVVLLSTLPFGIGEPLIRVPFWRTLLQALVSLAAIGGVAGLVAGLARRLSRNLDQSRQARRAGVGALVALPLLASIALYGLVRVGIPERERERDPGKREIILSPGFAWNIYARGGIDNPTAITFDDSGRLFIADISGALWVAGDTNGDGTVEQIRRSADGFSLLVGLAWREGELYAASSGKIEALRDADGDGVMDGRRTVVEGLPSMVLKPHSNNGIAFGADGRLYFGVGSTTDGMVEQNERAAAILSVNPDGSDLRVFARGLGNTFDVAFNSAGDLFGGDNSPIGEGDEPPDEFNFLAENAHYGFPYFYGDPPENGGTRGALVSFPAGSVPTGVVFYAGSAYPPEYRDSAFLALWGRGEIARVEVARAPSGNYLARPVTFASGFLYPVDVINGPDGNLYVADFGTSAIYRITYDPDKAW